MQAVPSLVESKRCSTAAKLQVSQCAEICKNRAELTFLKPCDVSRIFRCLEKDSIKLVVQGLDAAFDLLQGCLLVHS